MTQERKRDAGTPKLPRGRRRLKGGRSVPLEPERIKQKVGELFAAGPLFVQRRVSPSSRQRSSGFAGRAAGRDCAASRLMEEVYRLFDRRCTMATALAKLEKLRARLQQSPLRKVLEKNCLAPGWRRPWCSWTSGCWAQRPTRWSVAMRSLPQDAEDGVPGSDAAGDRGPAGAGPAAKPSPKAGLRPPRFCTRRGCPPVGFSERQGPAAIRHLRKESGHVRSRDDGRAPTASCQIDPG